MGKVMKLAIPDFMSRGDAIKRDAKGLIKVKSRPTDLILAECRPDHPRGTLARRAEKWTYTLRLGD